ncbi:MAG: SDR family NAD(P)-dependent oxidoreductase, partial [Chloroflexi bacterium]|nr:SDR family NAD(P)-dependent oxidoreductase [Chloroflexota bacterium]
MKIDPELLDRYSADIAVIGMAGRWPGAATVDQLWQNFRDGVEAVTSWSDDELLAAGVDPALLRDPNFVKAGSHLEDADLFDADFFGLTPKEAQILDPQQRLFIESAWNAIEGAGYDPSSYKGAIGVFAGVGLSTYLLNNLYPNTELIETLGTLPLVLGNDKDSLTTRTAYLLDLQGPCFTVQTYCSTSLVSVSIACNSLLNRESDMTLAGGVLVQVPQKSGYMYQEGGVASPDGRCRAFDAKANGSPLGNGVAVVLLKRMEDALRDGDTIHAVIRGSAVNNDGSLKVGYTAPGVRGQSNVILEALANADVDPEEISYIEAHGTGTPLGDAIEFAALVKAFRKTTDKNGFCAIGSAKTNLGHLDRAAGATGLIKTVLALKHKQIPPSLNYEQSSTQIDFANSPFFVNTTLRPWETGGKPRRAGVSAFGMGGTNAHVVLEEAPELPRTEPIKPWQLLILSAKSEAALDRATANLADQLEQQPDLALDDVAYTLQVGRRRFDHRRVVVARDSADAITKLRAPNGSQAQTSNHDGVERAVAYVLPGVGDHYVGMGQGLYATEPVFRQAVDRCCAVLRPLLGVDLRDHLFLSEPPSDDPATTTDLRAMLNRAPAAPTTLDQTQFAQPAVFVIGYALAQLWQHTGVAPASLLGYSLGEYLAATLAGVFSLEDGLTLVAERARLIAALPHGAMLAVALPVDEVRALLPQDLDIASINGPRATVVAGPLDAVAALERLLAQREVSCRRLPTTHAFHSRMMEPIADQIATLVSRFRRAAPQIPYVSNVTGTWITAEQAQDPAYWAQHLVAPVQFDAGVQTLLATEPVVLEVGAGQGLSAFIKQHPACSTDQLRRVLPSLRASYERVADRAQWLGTLGKLWLNGVTPTWTRLHTENRRRVPLPTYPFERQRFWIDAPKRHQPQLTARASSGKKPDIADWFYTPIWKQIDLPASSSTTEAQNWLILADSQGVSAALSQQLVAAGQHVVSVTPGDAFGRDKIGYTVRPDALADYTALLKDLRAADQLPQRIVHAWSLTSGEDPQRQQELGFYSLIALAQALGEAHNDEAITLLVLINETQPVQPGDALSPHKATILGPARVIPQEYPHIRCRAIDIDAYSEALFDEIRSSAADPMIAYRQGRRWSETFQPTRLENAGTPHRLRQQGVYLITGGLGEVGLIMAEYLARTAQARLVLVGRSALPAPERWDAWTHDHPDDRASRVIARLRELEAHGAQVLTVSADVTDEQAMRGVVETALRHFGRLDGVIHAAGETSESSFGAIQELERATAERHFGAKLNGTLVLERVLADQPLDFVLLLSSLSAVLGGLGFAAYTAANIAMDRVAERQAGRWTSINWDTWLGERTSTFGATVADFAMSPAEGMEAFARVLGSDLPRIVHSTGDLDARIKQWVLLESLVDRADSRTGSLRSITPAVNINDYEQRVIAIWRQVLGVDQIGLHDNFFDLGGNSLIGLQLIAQLKKEFQIQIPAVALFEAPTVSALVNYLRPELPVMTDENANQLEDRRKQARQSHAQAGIAIIGMAGRFPGANNIEQFWQNLRDGVESVSFFDEAELLEAGVPAEQLSQPNYVKARPILDDIEHFDAAFFGFSPREAALIDPQQRLFLECAYEALDGAGYTAQDYSGLVGVFGGANLSTYLLQLFRDPALAGEVSDYQAVIGNDKDALTTSVSYRLNLKGPSFAVQTFCSTSLVATHLACQSLRHGECDIALAGGVSVRVPKKSGHLYQQGGMESPDGHCRTFDARAQGGMFGDGVGIVVLKRLQDALEDGDQIYAVIKGSAINNDGALKVGYTAPSVQGQAEVVSTALAAADISADTISYIEAHGTATELGDPIEVASLTKAFRATTDKTEYCAIGSVKTNIGHLDRAAGATGLIKTVLALKHRQIPPSLHFESPNPEIDFPNSPFFVNTMLRDWQRNGTPRRAGVNSLGMGGTNAHVVLEEAPELSPSTPAQPWQLLTLSARTPTALDTATAELVAYLKANPESNLADVAYTLQVGRRRFDQRRVVVARDSADAIAKLDQIDPRHVLTLAHDNVTRAVAYVLPGVGDHYVGMGQGLYATEPVFRQAVDRCCAVLRPLLGVDLRDHLFLPEPPSDDPATTTDLRAMLNRAPAAPSTLDQTQFAQPAVFVIGYALAQLWQHTGVAPAHLLGYSLGEYLAATLAGVFSLEDGLTLVAERARLIAALPQGAMLAVALPVDEVRALLPADLDIASINGPRATVVAGPLDAVAALEQLLAQREISCRRLPTTHAFHSRMLQPIADEIAGLVSRFRRSAPQIPYISNVTGTWITADQAQDPAYWATHLVAPVQFDAGVYTLLASAPVVLEVGAGQGLSAFIKQHPACSTDQMRRVLPSLRASYERIADRAQWLGTLGKLWLNGVTPNWQRLHADATRRRLLLPTYPFERQRFWITPQIASQRAQQTSTSLEPTLDALPRAALDDWFFLPGWKQTRPHLPATNQASRNWLIFSDTQGVGANLARRLEALGQTVTCVEAGSLPGSQSSGLYTIRPRARADYDALLRELRDQGRLPQQIVHLWSVTEDAPQLDETQLERALDLGFYSLLSLSQALGEIGLSECQLDIVSSPIFNITGGEKIRPELATVIGPAKVIPLEYAGLRCRSIDLELPVTNRQLADAIQTHLLGEILAPITERVVALRGRHRWVQAFEPFALPQPEQRSPQLRERGVYLITGGLGGIGLGIAEHLARSVQARLVLVGRSGLPERDEWPQILTNDPAGVGARIGQIQALEALGAEVLVVKADVADRTQMTRCIEQTIGRFGALHGVIHAAGVPGIGLIPLKTPEQALSVLAPKVQGTLVLHELLADIPLDFFALFSSITSATGGGPGQIDYCAANAFLDAFAQRYADAHGRTIAINWGEWQWNAWEKGLEGYNPEVQTFFRENRKRFGIEFAEGSAAF